MIEASGTAWLQHLSMGGYGLYIWTAYSIVATLMLLGITVPLVRFKRWKNKQGVET